MDIFKLKDLSMSERMLVLESEASEVEEQSYLKPLNDTDLAIIKDELAQNCIKKGFIDDELSQVKKAFKAKLDPLSDAISVSIESLKTRAHEVTGKVYKLSDFDNKMCHYVDIEGNVLNSRMMKPEERQLRIGQTKTA